MNDYSLVTVIGAGPVSSGVKLFIETAWLALRFVRDPHCYRVVRHGSVLQALCKYEHVTDKICVKCKVKGVRLKVTSRMCRDYRDCFVVSEMFAHRLA